MTETKTVFTGENAALEFDNLDVKFRTEFGTVHAVNRHHGAARPLPNAGNQPRQRCATAQGFTGFGFHRPASMAAASPPPLAESVAPGPARPARPRPVRPPSPRYAGVRATAPVPPHPA